MSNGVATGPSARPSPRQTVCREAVGAGAVVSAKKMTFDSRAVRRVRLNSPNIPIIQQLASRRRLKKG